MRKLLTVFVTLALTWPAAAWPRRDRGDNEKAAGRETPPVEVTNPDTIARTYLDTLNAGVEISVSAADIPRIVTETPVVPVEQNVNQQNAASVRPPAPSAAPPAVFRIQCLATSDIEKARVAKRTLESKVRQPVNIFSELPYYKVQVGELKARAEAESLLETLKAMGYPDAWIVKPANTPDGKNQ